MLKDLKLISEWYIPPLQVRPEHISFFRRNENMSTASKKIRPLSDRIVVQPREVETKTAGGIVIPDSADKDKPIQGTVIAIGTGKYVDGKIVPLQVKVGDKVLFGKYSGTNVKLDDQEYLVMREEDVMGVLEE
jgi:chaperonin GroES